MGRHSNHGRHHQAGHERVTVAALIMRDEHPTIPMTVVLDAPPTNVIDPWSDWTPTDQWLAQHSGTATLAVTA
jgi:hypothetical protein